MESPDLLKELYARYLVDECTAEEIGQLLEQFGRPQNEAALRDLIRRQLETDALSEGREEEWKEQLASTYRRLLTRIHAGEPAAAAPVVPLVRRKMFRYAVAAVLLLAVASAAYFYTTRKREVQLAAGGAKPAPQQDVAPGGDRAMLVLADGRTVWLDSAANGDLARQGGTRVVKQAGGQVVYEAGTADGGALLYNTIATPRGGQYRLVLPDGSQVWLNAASSLRFPTAFAGSERVVEARGEVYFKVQKDAARPFKVLVNGATTVEVLGTEFNVMAYEEEEAQQTTLVEGSVKVYNGTHAQVLQPGQQARVAPDGGISRVTDVDVAHATAWKNGLFVFQEEKIPAIMRQLARWYDVEIAYEGPVPQGHYVGAVRRQSNISDVLKMLSLAGGVQFTVEGKKVIVRAL